MGFFQIEISRSLLYFWGNGLPPYPHELYITLGGMCLYIPALLNSKLSSATILVWRHGGWLMKDLGMYLSAISTAVVASASASATARGRARAGATVTVTAIFLGDWLAVTKPRHRILSSWPLIVVRNTKVFSVSLSALLWKGGRSCWSIAASSLLGVASGQCDQWWPLTPRRLQIVLHWLS